MVYKIILRQRRVPEPSLFRILRDNELSEAALKISEKQIVIPGGKQLQDIAVIFLQMLKKMQKHRIGCIFPWDAWRGRGEVPWQYR